MNKIFWYLSISGVPFQGYCYFLFYFINIYMCLCSRMYSHLCVFINNNQALVLKFWDHLEILNKIIRVSHMYKRCPNMYLYWTLLPHSTQTKKINYLINIPFEEEAKNNNKTKKQNKNYTILFQQAASLSLLLTQNSNFSTLSTIAECVRREHGKLG